ncbi:MAG: DUF1922 domain-containing protein [Promethearchaeota archaeon]
MNNLYYFYRCYHCGYWHYSAQKIKKKKCLSCNKTFQFNSATKFSKKCSPHQAIAIMKKLKEGKHENMVLKFQTMKVPRRFLS